MSIDKKMVLDYLKDTDPDIPKYWEHLENITVNGSVLQVEYRDWTGVNEVIHIELFVVLVWLYKRVENLNKETDK